MRHAARALNGSIGDIAHRLTAHIETIAKVLLGQPTQITSHEMRWGRKGSLWVGLSGSHRGRFADFESGENGDALELIRYARGGSFRDALTWSRDWLSTEPIQMEPTNLLVPDRKTESDDCNERRRIDYAMAIWAETMPLSGTPAEVYLRYRHIPICNVRDLRFHPKCPAGPQGERLPAMVGLMTDIATGKPKAIHRTFLLPHGKGKATTRDGKSKKILGPARGSAIRLCPDEELSIGLGLTEGIENGLTLICRGWRPIWAAGSAGSIKRFPALNGIEHLTIFADADDGGTGLAAARACGLRWQDAGRAATIRIPALGSDWNDWAQGVCFE